MKKDVLMFRVSDDNKQCRDDIAAVLMGEWSPDDTRRFYRDAGALLDAATAGVVQTLGASYFWSDARPLLRLHRPRTADGAFAFHEVRENLTRFSEKEGLVLHAFEPKEPCEKPLFPVQDERREPRHTGSPLAVTAFIMGEEVGVVIHGATRSPAFYGSPYKGAGVILDILTGGVPIPAATFMQKGEDAIFQLHHVIKSDPALATDPTFEKVLARLKKAFAKKPGILLRTVPRCDARPLGPTPYDTPPRITPEMIIIPCGTYAGQTVEAACMPGGKPDAVAIGRLASSISKMPDEQAEFWKTAVFPYFVRLICGLDASKSISDAQCEWVLTTTSRLLPAAYRDKVHIQHMQLSKYDAKLAVTRSVIKFLQQK